MLALCMIDRIQSEPMMGLGEVGMPTCFIPPNTAFKTA